MSFLRSRWFVFVFFSLVSLGQAYPYSVAWASTKKTQTCCCQDKHEHCGCSHEKHGGASKKFRCHEAKTAGYAPAPCGRPSDQQALSFQSELFLPSLPPSFVELIQKQILFENLVFLPSFASRPEAPPPRVG